MEPGAALVTARLLHYAGALVVFGAALFPSYAFGRATPPTGSESTFKRIRVSAAILAVVGAVLTLMATAANMAGDIAAARQPEMLAAVALETEFGRIWVGRLAVGGLVLALAVSGAGSGWLPILSAGFLASIALTGHARVETGAGGLAHMSVDALHLLAAGAWLGALMPLGWLASRRPEAEGTAAAMRRFAGVGALSVAMLVATGGANAAFLVEQPAAVFTTNYGRLLALKVGFFALMLGLAALNRFAVVPRLGGADHHASIRRLRAHIALEQLLGLLVIAAVALLGTMDPAA